jgi:hypothetical protein
MGQALLWYWRYGALCCELEESLEEAISYALGMEDHGNGSLSCIEHDGQVYDTTHPVLEKARAKRDQEERQERAEQPRLTHKVELCAPFPDPRGYGPPKSLWSAYSAFPDREAAEAAAAVLAEVVGSAERVRVKGMR